MSTLAPYLVSLVIPCVTWWVGRANNVRKTCQFFYLLKVSWC